MRLNLFVKNTMHQEKWSEVKQEMTQQIDIFKFALASNFEIYGHIHMNTLKHTVNEAFVLNFMQWEIHRFVKGVCACVFLPMSCHISISWIQINLGFLVSSLATVVVSF